MRTLLILAGALTQLAQRVARGYLARLSFWLPFTVGAFAGWSLANWALARGLRCGALPLGWLPLALSVRLSARRPGTGFRTSSGNSQSKLAA